MNIGPSTETPLTAAAALADAMPNPTTTQVGANLLGWGGPSGWDRLVVLDGHGGDTDGLGPAVQALITSSRSWRWNGSTYDRVYNNIQGTLLASAARTATTASPDQTNFNSTGKLRVYVDVTVAGTGSITVEIDEKDPISGAYIAILTSAAITANGETVLRVGVGLTAAANSVANDFVPRAWRVNVTANNSNAMTYSVGYALVN